jgi:hypothetical protein
MQSISLQLRKLRQIIFAPDDDLLKKTSHIQGLKTKVVSPLELVEEISK